MSRSYRHNPFATIRSKTDKKLANRKIRNTKDVPSGGAFRKVYETSFCGCSNYYNDVETYRK